MLETLVVFGLLAAVMLGCLLIVAVNWVTLILSGAALIALGSVVGVPTGFWYHVRLHAHLAPRGELPPGWWWNPVKYHDKLLDEERQDVLRWFYVGGGGFMVIVAGCVLLALGVLVAK
jgi:hypothetical protein